MISTNKKYSRCRIEKEIAFNLSNYDENRPTVQYDAFFETPATPSPDDIEREKTIDGIVNKWNDKGENNGSTI